MLSKKTFFSIFLITIFVISLFSFDEYTKADNSTSKQEKVSKIVTNLPNSGWQTIAENQQLTIYLNPKNLGLKVLNKETGYIWHGTQETNDEELNSNWQNFFRAPITIEYMDAKKKLNQVSVSEENAKIVVRKEGSGFIAEINFLNEGISLNLVGELMNDSLRLSIPFSSIKETKKGIELEALYLYPYFGAVKGLLENSYMFVPDGSGALIDMGKQTIATQPFSMRVYGSDLGINSIAENKKNLAKPTEKIYLPVYGMVHHEGENGFVSFLKEGAPFAEIKAYSAGITTNYNWMTTKFLYRETYFQPLDKKGNGITLNQKELNNFDIDLRISFLANEKANYLGMAKRVQEELVKDNILTKKSSFNNLPIRLEFLSAESRKEFLGQKVIRMTTVNEIEKIITELQQNGIKRITGVVRGWNSGGISNLTPKSKSFEEKIGSIKDWQNLRDKFKEDELSLYFYTDFLKVSNELSNFSEQEIARNYANQLINLTEKESLLAPKISEKYGKELLEVMEKNSFNNLALASIGDILFSSYNQGSISRNEAIKIYQELLNTKERIALYKPYYYLWKYTDSFFDLPLNSTNLLIETEDVPFLAIVLRGYLDIYSTPINLSADLTNFRLQLIDYGIYPSFYLTYQDSVNLLNTKSEWLYSSQYAIWKEEISKIYNYITKPLTATFAADLVKREKITAGVIRNTYSNGKVIVINYNEDDYLFNQLIIPAKSYLLLKGEEK